MNQPLEVIVDVCNSLLHMAAYGEKDELRVKRLEREVRTLQQRAVADPQLEWLAIGAACLMQGRHEECLRAFDNVVKLSRPDSMMIVNVQSLLLACGEIGRALALVRATVERAEEVDDKRAFLAVVTTLGKTLCFEEQHMAAERFGIDIAAPLRDSAQALLNIANAHGLTPERRLSLIKTAAEAVRRQGYAIRQSHLVQVDEILRYEFFIDETAEQCSAVNWAIADALCEQFEDPAPEFVTFACRPLSSFRFSGHFDTVNR